MIAANSKAAVKLLTAFAADKDDATPVCRAGNDLGHVTFGHTIKVGRVSMNVTVRLTGFGLVALALAGCTTRAVTPLPQEQILTGQMLNQADANFVTESYRIVQMDNEEGQLAAVQSANPRVRALAAEIVSKANRLYPEMEAAIHKNGITPPRDLPGDLRARLDRTRSLRGAAFDRSYLADQVETHERALRVFQAEQARTQDPAMRALVEEATPVVQEDLAKLQALQGG